MPTNTQIGFKEEKTLASFQKMRPKGPHNPKQHKIHIPFAQI